MDRRCGGSRIHPLNLGHCTRRSAAMARTEQEPACKTFSFRVKDATSGKHLVVLGNATNAVWNYCNEVSERSARRGPKWATKKQLGDLTKGASRELGLPSQVIQEVIDEFITKRRKAGRPKLRWRVSHGVRRSLGWIPFTNQDVGISGSVALFRGRKVRLWKHREIEGRFKSGNFSQDARGRWYCNIVCAVERSTTNRTHVVGIDLGHKTAAQCSDGPELPQARFYRDLEDKLAGRGAARWPQAPGADDPCQDRQPEKGQPPQVLPGGGQPLGCRLCRRHLITLADRIGRREGDTRCELVDAAQLP